LLKNALQLSVERANDESRVKNGGTKAKKKKRGETGIKKKYSLNFFFFFELWGGPWPPPVSPQIRHWKEPRWRHSMCNISVLEINAVKQGVSIYIPRGLLGVLFIVFFGIFSILQT
jgi:hypothetical protein